MCSRTHTQHAQSANSAKIHLLRQLETGYIDTAKQKQQQQRNVKQFCCLWSSFTLKSNFCIYSQLSLFHRFQLYCQRSLLQRKVNLIFQCQFHVSITEWMLRWHVPCFNYWVDEDYSNLFRYTILFLFMRTFQIILSPKPICKFRQMCAYYSWFFMHQTKSILSDKFDPTQPNTSTLK